MTLAGVGLLLMAAMLLAESPWTREWLADRISQRLEGRNVEIGSLDIGWGWPLTVRLEDVAVDNPGWASQERMLEFEALEMALSPDALLSGRFELARLSLSQPVIHLARRKDGTSNWGGLAGEDDPSSQGRGLGINPAVITVDEGRLTFHDPTREADLDLAYRSRDGEAGARELSVEARGRVRGVPVELTGHGGLPSGDGDAYSLLLEGHLGQLTTRFDGQLRDVSEAVSLEGRLDVSASQTSSVAQMLGRPAWNLPSLDLHGRLSYQDRRWSLQDASVRLGETEGRGALSIAAGDERPEIQVRWHAGRLDLSRWDLSKGGEPTSSAGRQASSAQGIRWGERLARQLAPLRGVDAQVDLSVDQLSHGDTRLSNVGLQGSLEEGELVIQRLRATQGQGELMARGRAELLEDSLTAGLEAELSRFDMNAALAPLGYAGLGTWDGHVGLQLPADAADQDQRPRIDAQLDIDHLNLAQLDVTQAGGGPSSRDPNTPGPDAAWHRDLAEQLEPLRWFDASVDLAINRLSYGDTALGNVDLEGRLEAGRLEVRDLHAAQDRGALTARGWLAIQPQTLSGDFDARLSQLDLGEALAPLGSGHLGTLDGRLHARLMEGELTLDDTSLEYRWPSRDLFLDVNAVAAPPTNASAPRVQLQGHGRHHGEAFEYDLLVGPLLNLRDPGKPYPVQGRVTSGDSTLHVDGTLEKPLELGVIRTSFRLSGPNPARLSTLTGLNFPALPPYALEGELRVRDNLVRLLNLDGTFGDSNVSGDVRLRLGERNMLWATLHSRRLDLDDLAPLVGSPPEVGPGETASPAQQSRAHEQGPQRKLFSDRQWNLPGLRKMDAQVRYTAERVNAETVPLSSVSLELMLEEGVLTLEPLRMGLGGGTVEARLRLDAHGQALDGSLDLSARRVNLKPVLRRAGVTEIAEDSAGTLGGQGSVRFTGGSMAESMANLQGGLELAMSGGRLDTLLMETVGLDVVESLLVEAADADKVPMRCGYARLEADGGVVSIKQFFISTADSNITGGGQVNLQDERLNLVFEAHPKDPSLLASDSPVRIQGDLTTPQVDMVSRELIARGVLSVLGALVAPPLAILPWIEPGTGESVGPGCRRVIEDFPAAPSGES